MYEKTLDMTRPHWILSSKVKDMTISLLVIPNRIAKVRKMDMFSSESVNPGVFPILNILTKEVLVSYIE